MDKPHKGKVIMKKISHLSYLIIMLLSLAIPTQIFAQETKPVDENNMAKIASNQLAVSTLEYEPTSSRCKLHYKKSQVKTYNVWSSKKRVSEDIVTDATEDSLSPSKIITFGTIFEGLTSGLNFQKKFISSSTSGYVLHVAPYKRAYVAYRVLYRVETGYREVFNQSDKLVKSNWYTVKVPQYGEYSLITY